MSWASPAGWTLRWPGRLAQLAVEELAAEGVEANFVAVRLPYGVQHDEDDAQAALDFVQAKTEWTFNISAAVDGFEDEFEKTVGTGSPISTRATPRPGPG